MHFEIGDTVHATKGVFKYSGEVIGIHQCENGDSMVTFNIATNGGLLAYSEWAHKLTPIPMTSCALKALNLWQFRQFREKMESLQSGSA